MFCVTERMTENVNLFVQNVANMYVLNTRTLSASTLLSLILLILLLLLLLFSFVLICKCVQGLLLFAFFASVFKVCVVISVYLQVVWWFVLGDIYVRRIDEISRLRCRTIIIE